MKYTRRDFVKTNAIVGTGAMMGFNFAVPNVKPALTGGKPVRTASWPTWPKWNPETDEPRVLEVLRSGVWSRSEVVKSFENKWAKTTGSKRCVTVVNGTNALIASLTQAGIGGGDEVLVSSYTFIASVAAILQTGAMPVFVDSDPETFQLDPEEIKKKINSKTRAILPVHILGLPADMDSIMTIAKQNDLIVVEDACQGWLAEYDHKKVGTFGLAGCFSFQNSKNLPMGEGGAIVSDNDEFMDKCFSYHNYGYPYGSLVGAVNQGAVMAGTKIRLTEYQAAIGLSQLERLDDETRLRETNASYLKEQLEGIPGISTYVLYPKVNRAVFHLFPFRFHTEGFKGLSRDVFIKALRAEGIPCSSGYTPLNDKLYLKDAFSSKNYQRMYQAEELDFEKFVAENQCPITDKLCNEEAIWLSQRMLLGSRTDMDDIANAIKKIHENVEELLNYKG